MPLPKREYSAVSAITDEIWQYRTGGNLTILTKVTTLQKQGSCSQAYGFAIKRGRMREANLKI
jgi:hypothetical protein